MAAIDGPISASAMTPDPYSVSDAVFGGHSNGCWPKDPSNVKGLLSQMRTLVATLPNFRPNPDPDHLLRFLRAKKYNVDKAFHSYKKMYAARLAKPNEYFPRGSGSKEVMNVFDLKACAILPQLNPSDGTFVAMVRVGDWTDDCGVDLDKAITPILLVGEALLTSPTVQLNGGQLVFDMQGTSVSNARQFNYTALKTLLSLANGGYPCRLKAFHILNNNAAFKVLFGMVKAFLRAEVVKRIHLHGSNVEKLHEFISTDILPNEYGGTAGQFPWKLLRDEMERRHEEFVELSWYGFQVGGLDPPIEKDVHPSDKSSE